MNVIEGPVLTLAVLHFSHHDLIHIDAAVLCDDTPALLSLQYREAVVGVTSVRH